MRTTYQYCILRYVHDLATDEFVNVGVVAYAADRGELASEFRVTYGRITSTFPDLDGKVFRTHVSSIRSSFCQLEKRIKTELPLGGLNNFSAILAEIVPVDDSCFQWSEVRVGATDDLRRSVSGLFSRVVSHYDEASKSEGRNDEAIWQIFRSMPAMGTVLSVLAEKKIVVDGEPIVFKHAFKNGVWNCLEPVSFDLSTDQGIRDKAHRLLGATTMVSHAKEAVKVYLLTGKPRSKELIKPFESAIKVLERIPLEKEVVFEEEREEFSKRLAKLVRDHSSDSALRR